MTNAWIWMLLSPIWLLFRGSVFVGAHWIAVLVTLLAIIAACILVGLLGFGSVPRALARLVAMFALPALLAGFSVWSVLTAALVVVAGPFREWSERGWTGMVALVLLMLGGALWALVGVGTFVAAVHLVPRAWRGQG